MNYFRTDCFIDNAWSKAIQNGMDKMKDARNMIVKFNHSDTGTQFGYLDCANNMHNPVIHCLCGCEKTFPHSECDIFARYPNFNVSTLIADNTKCNGDYIAVKITNEEKRKMKVERTIEIVTNDYKVGDKITVGLADHRKIKATIQKIDENGPLFMFDDAVARRPINGISTNKDGFENSDLNEWLMTDFVKLLPDELRNRITDLSIPTYGQIFGHDDYYDNFEPDDDNQFPLMRDIRNRIAFYNGELDWYWLKNATKKEVSSSLFACVTGYGRAASHDADLSYGVRPVFRLK